MPSLRAVSLLVLATAVALAGCRTPALEEPAAAEGLDPFPAQGVDHEEPLPPEADDEPGPEPPRPRPFRGLGAWIDIYDGKLWRDPEGTVARLARRGVRTLFLQTTNFRNPGPIRYPRKTGRFLEGAHAHGINVVGWYLPDLKRLRRDLAWSMAAVGYESRRGHRFDGFAMDIEATEVADPGRRAERAVLLSERLRREVGPDYPLGGIVPSPLRGPLYWPVLPLRRFAEIYDVILPMAYWDGHARGARGAHAYIARSIDLLRAEGGPDLPLHVIGGVAEDATPEEMRGFRRAVRGRGLVGASIYDVDSMRPAHWREIEPLAGSFRPG